MLRSPTFACAVMLTVFASQAIGAPVVLPDASWSFGSFVGVGPDFSGVANNLDFSADAPFVTQSVSAPGGFAEVRSAPTPVPSITAAASSTATNRIAGAQGNLLYSVMVSGPLASVPVSINISAFGSLFSMPGNPLAGSNIGSGGRARLYVNGMTILDRISDQGINAGAFSVATTLTVTANESIGVQMIAYAITQGVSQSAITFIDPYFSLDSDLVNAGYTIITSAGIGNALPSPVPLPAMLSVLASALGMLGLSGHRRRQRTRNASSLH